MMDTRFSDPSATGKPEPFPHSPEQQRIMQVLAQIPAGKVATYGQLALLAGLPGYARYVGTTLKQLPKDSRLPWHRVINARGELSLSVDSEGYKRQRARLLEEGISVHGARISLPRYQWQPGS